MLTVEKLEALNWIYFGQDSLAKYGVFEIRRVRSLLGVRVANRECISAWWNSNFDIEKINREIKLFRKATSEALFDLEKKKKIFVKIYDYHKLKNHYDSIFVKNMFFYINGTEEKLFIDLCKQFLRLNVND